MFQVANKFTVDLVDAESNLKLHVLTDTEKKDRKLPDDGRYVGLPVGRPLAITATNKRLQDADLIVELNGIHRGRYKVWAENSSTVERSDSDGVEHKWQLNAESRAVAEDVDVEAGASANGLLELTV